MSQNPFKKGDRVRIVGTVRKGIITKVITDINQINWVDHKPHFLELCMDDAEYVLASPFQITRKRA